jgi:hypothetical protein
MFSNDTFSLCVINPAKPPAKVSPVGSKPLPMAKLVQRKPEDHETVKHRVPFLITTYFVYSLDFGRRFNQRIFSRKLSCFLIIDCYYIYFITSSNSGNAQSIQNSWYLKPNFGLVSIWSKTLLCTIGCKFPSITTSVL